MFHIIDWVFSIEIFHSAPLNPAFVRRCKEIKDRYYFKFLEDRLNSS